jgi:pimeloyl-ACP methyl ester carboxylesterase
MSERGWRRGDFAEFEGWCGEAFGARTAHLRYNTGRRISTNAAELAALLEDMVEAEGVKRLVLIGHSMGGLLYRSAAHQARLSGHRWPQAVTHIAMLGSPHNGSPWERLGNHANRLLKFSPYTLPFATFGDLRSLGIKDLRHGNLLDSDWQQVDDPDHRHDPRQPVPLLDTAQHLALAASRSPQIPYHVWEARDDMLVPVASALGMSLNPDRALSHPRLRREVLPNLDHLNLMGDARVWDLLREWLMPAH